ncbi:head-tail adaptor protein [Clostridium botulinum]|uniref:phage head closure protein n=1 Tax=Clostridium botulinum TaxID=1491 RepID=UPI000773D5B0|nr:phage head closure protein [Clostridium botulinum]MBN3405734.1 head-tail adaptor protein [Clostridium botulinum]NEZ83803.1 head-tail adaptor protein [Clostridium botulinum]NFA06944.1 head-tail adaptor protein [Clostridium botulinum]NFA25876.1 head-tail adaptor protein [Clostridium botulinum]NFB80801.1 head-tail adaptor protein [Clostridium botulinum]
MDPGKLNKKIKFVVMEDGTDDDGYPIKDEKLIRDCWASVRGLKGRTFYAAAQTQSENNKIFKCRYFKGLTEDMLIKYDKKLYTIESINDIEERHIEYEIHASVVSSSG